MIDIGRGVDEPPVHGPRYGLPENHVFGANRVIGNGASLSIQRATTGLAPYLVIPGRYTVVATVQSGRMTSDPLVIPLGSNHGSLVDGRARAME